MPRKLVTVRRVSALKPIPGADRIQSASLDGWTCIVPIGDFQTGDLGVFFEIDCLLPGSDPRFAFLASKNGSGSEDIRIKTTRIRNSTSQGLLMPLSKFSEINEVVDKLTAALGRDGAEKELRGMSFEDVLGVRKFERPAAARNNNGGDPNPFTAEFPCFVPKTDQERVQNLPDVFDTYRDAVFQETTKMDGSSMTVYFLQRNSQWFDMLPPLAPNVTASKFSNGRVGVCSRNRDIGETVPHSGFFWETALAGGIPSALAKCGRNIALQGELCGSSIQSNFEGFARGTHEFYLFSIWDIDAQQYLAPREVHETWAPRLGVKHVPVVGYSRLHKIGSSVGDLVARADGVGINGRKREGIVLKHINGEFSFKAISNSYLLKHGE